MTLNLRRPELRLERAFINGEWIDAAQRFVVRNPADASELAQVPDVGAEGARAAVDAAYASQRAWRTRPAGERATLLRRWNDLVLENLEDLEIGRASCRERV